MNNIVLTTYFTTRPDPQRGIMHAPGSLELMSRWMDSLTALGLDGVIFHDEPIGCSDGHVQLCQYEPTTVWSVNDERFLCWLRYLQDHPDLDNVFLTDLFDVDFVADPFRLIGSAFDLYVGCGAGFDRTIEQNAWLAAKMMAAYGRVHHGDRRTVNAGVIGGRRAALLRLLEYMVCDFVRINSKDNINMAVFNKAVYDLFPADRVLVGPPVTSRFKKYESSGDFTIRHK